jgi:hypothetical protein
LALIRQKNDTLESSRDESMQISRSVNDLKF